MESQPQLPGLSLSSFLIFIAVTYIITPTVLVSLLAWQGRRLMPEYKGSQKTSPVALSIIISAVILYITFLIEPHGLSEGGVSIWVKVLIVIVLGVGAFKAARRWQTRAAAPSKKPKK